MGERNGAAGLMAFAWVKVCFREKKNENEPFGVML